MEPRVEYETKIIGVKKVFFVGTLSFGTWLRRDGAAASWHVFDGKQWHDLDMWLDKFSGRDVAITISDTNYEHHDDGRMLVGMQEEYESIEHGEGD